MAVYVNKSGNPLGVPGKEVTLPGGEVELSDTDVKNVGVAKFIEDGWLAKKAGRPSKSE